MSNKNSILLFNPWIYDFAAYDFWFKPLGMLYIGSILRQLGYSVQLVDCLDRFHPALLNDLDKNQLCRADFSGKFHREIIGKPDVLGFVPRHYSRYGMPIDLVKQLLSILNPPDVILVTSFMTYWYPAVKDAIALLREYFPEATIILGGVYATLCPQHARAHAAPDYIITGEGEVSAVHCVAELLNGPGADFNYSGLDELPLPALDLYPQLKSVALLTSRGCPNSCRFCASKSLAAGYRRRSAQNVVSEIEHWQQEYNVNHYSFFDDALLFQSTRYIKPILQRMIEKSEPVHFYTPNGLTPRFVDKEMAELFWASNVKHVRLSFETSNEERQKSMSAKVTNSALRRALYNLECAGYKKDDIGVYVLMGLPGQSVDEVRQSVLFVHQLGARINLASFSPIPGTLEWQDALEKQMWNPEIDLLLTNTTLFPIWSNTIGYQACNELLHWVSMLNDQLLKE